MFKIGLDRLYDALVRVTAAETVSRCTSSAFTRPNKHPARRAPVNAPNGHHEAQAVGSIKTRKTMRSLISVEGIPGVSSG